MGKRLCRKARLAVVLGISTAALSSGGCVKYVPVELDAVPEGEEVHVRLTDAGAIRAARQLGGIRSALDASVAPQDSDSMAVTIWLGKDYPGTSFENVRETVVFPRDEVIDLSLTELDVPRTAAIAAGAVAVFAVLVDRLFFKEDPNPTDEPPDENPPPASLTLFSFTIGRNQ
jgi:hypothetical protein